MSMFLATKRTLLHLATLSALLPTACIKNNNASNVKGVSEDSSGDTSLGLIPLQNYPGNPDLVSMDSADPGVRYHRDLVMNTKLFALVECYRSPDGQVSADDALFDLEVQTRLGNVYLNEKRELVVGSDPKKPPDRYVQCAVVNKRLASYPIVRNVLQAAQSTALTSQTSMQIAQFFYLALKGYTDTKIPNRTSAFYEVFQEMKSQAAEAGDATDFDALFKTLDPILNPCSQQDPPAELGDNVKQWRNANFQCIDVSNGKGILGYTPGVNSSNSYRDLRLMLKGYIDDAHAKINPPPANPGFGLADAGSPTDELWDLVTSTGLQDDGVTVQTWCDNPAPMAKYLCGQQGSGFDFAGTFSNTDYAPIGGVATSATGSSLALLGVGTGRPPVRTNPPGTPPGKRPGTTGRPPVNPTTTQPPAVPHTQTPQTFQQFAQQNPAVANAAKASLNGVTAQSISGSTALSSQGKNDAQSVLNALNGQPSDWKVAGVSGTGNSQSVALVNSQGGMAFVPTARGGVGSGDPSVPIQTWNKITASNGQAPSNTGGDIVRTDQYQGNVTGPSYDGSQVTTISGKVRGPAGSPTENEMGVALHGLNTPAFTGTTQNADGTISYSNTPASQQAMQTAVNQDVGNLRQHLDTINADLQSGTITSDQAAQRRGTLLQQVRQDENTVQITKVSVNTTGYDNLVNQICSSQVSGATCPQTQIRADSSAGTGTPTPQGTSTAAPQGTGTASPQGTSPPTNSNTTRNSPGTGSAPQTNSQSRTSSGTGSAPQTNSQSRTSPSTSSAPQTGSSSTTDVEKPRTPTDARVTTTDSDAGAQVDSDRRTGLTKTSTPTNSDARTDNSSPATSTTSNPSVSSQPTFDPSTDSQPASDPPPAPSDDSGDDE